MAIGRNKDLIFSLICGLLSGIFFLFIIFNPKFTEVEKLPWLKKYAFFFPFLFAILFSIGAKVAFFLGRFWSVFFQFIKFMEIGVLNTLIDVGTLNGLSALTGFTVPPQLLILNAISFCLAVTNSYFWNKSWTFDRGAKMVQKEFYLFIIVSLIGLLINSLIVFLGTIFLAKIAISEGALINIVKLLATFIVMIWNFVGYKIFVFRKNEPSSTL